MASTTTATRRVLADLNVNTPPASRHSLLNTGKEASCAAQQAVLAKTVSIQTSFESAMPGTIREEAPMGNTKRHAEFPEDDAECAKRRKGGAGVFPGVRMDKTLSVLETSRTIGVADEADLQYRSPASSHGLDGRDTPSSVSPASSFGGSSNGAMNDSQNTVVTEPDDVPGVRTILRIPSISVPPNSSPMTQEELRQKARAIRLRLGLASYKVRTNQIDIPMSRLQIKTTGTSPRLPTLPRANTSKRRTPLPTIPTLPSAPKTIPNIKLQLPSSSNEKSREGPPQEPDIPSSPPTAYRGESNTDNDNINESNTAPVSPRKDTDDAREGFATPLLPRQRQGLLNPPALGSPLWDERKSERELTSSVVKGRAADGLLSLMRQG